MNTTKDNAYLRLHIGILIAGGTGIFGTMISLAEIPLVWYRMLTASIVMVLIMLYNRRLHRLPLPHLVKISGCGALLAIHWVMFYASIKASNVSIAVVCIALDGFFTALLDPLISHRRFSLREVLLSLIALAGILLIFGFDSRYRLGIIFGILTSFFYALFSIYSKGIQHTPGYQSSTMLLYELISGWLLLTLFLPFYSMLNPSLSLTPSTADWIMLPIFGSFFTIGPFLLQLQALRSISAFTVNLSYNLEPIYSIIFALIIFDEANELNRYFWLGVLLIILSVVLQTIYSRHKKRV